MNGMTESRSYHNRIDPQDVWEAYQTFRTARNLFFWVLLLGLLLLQCCFWLVNRGYVDPVLAEQLQNGSSIFLLAPACAPSPCTLSADTGFHFTQEIRQEPKASAPEPLPQEEPEKESRFRSFGFARSLDNFLKIIIPATNFFLTFAAVLYCLCLLIGLKLGLVGHLPGLAPAGKAFFLSLVLMVLVVPWQSVFAPNVFGALYPYPYLLEHYIQYRQNDMLTGCMLFYFRFVGLWLISLLLLLAIQWRSHQAVKTIRRRLAASSPAPASGGIPLSDITPRE